MNDPLDSWAELNKALRDMKEDACWKLLAKEKKGKKRLQFALRIFGRANKLRTDRERNAVLD